MLDSMISKIFSNLVDSVISFSSETEVGLVWFLAGVYYRFDFFFLSCPLHSLRGRKVQISVLLIHVFSSISGSLFFNTFLALLHSETG